MTALASQNEDVTAEIEKVYYSSQEDALCARVRACNRDGQCARFTVKYDVSKARKMVLNYIRSHYGNNEVSGFVDDIKNTAANIVKKLGVDKLTQKIGDIVDSGGFQEALAIGGAVFPPLGITVNAVKKVTEMVDGVKSGDPAARAKLNAIVARAQYRGPNVKTQAEAEAAKKLAVATAVVVKIDKEAGVPPADQAALVESRQNVIRNAAKGLASGADLVTLAKKVDGIYVAGVMGKQVSGWLYNKQYRTPVEAIMESSKSPLMAIRYLYNKGAEKALDIVRNRKAA